MCQAWTVKKPRERTPEQDVKALLARAINKSRRDPDVDAMLERLHAPPAKQARSLETANRLLDATEQILEEDGLDGATVPSIAARAGVSVGVVYRRFPDKDTLLRAVWERFLDFQRKQTAAILAASEGMNIELEVLMRGMIRASLEAYRKRRNLLLALRQYARASNDPVVRQQAHDLNRASTSAVAVLMLRQRKRIKHPNPEAAIEFAVITMASVIQMIVIEQTNLGLRVPSSLEEELTRMLLAYLES